MMVNTVVGDVCREYRFEVLIAIIYATLFFVPLCTFLHIFTNKYRDLETYSLLYYMHLLYASITYYLLRCSTPWLKKSFLARSRSVKVFFLSVEKFFAFVIGLIIYAFAQLPTILLLGYSPYPVAISYAIFSLIIYIILRFINGFWHIFLLLPYFTWLLLTSFLNNVWS